MSSKEYPFVFDGNMFDEDSISDIEYDFFQSIPVAKYLNSELKCSNTAAHVPCLVHSCAQRL